MAQIWVLIFFKNEGGGFVYDYLLVGAGLYNAVFAETALRHGRSCLVVERRNHIGGNCYTYEQAGIIVNE